MKFSIFKTKTKKIPASFDLSNPKEYRKYFELKAGPEIKKLREYLKQNTFIAYLLGKKVSGKGTYARIFREIVDPQKVDHFSIGDMVREIDEELVIEKKKKKLIEFLEKNYRGFLPLKKAIQALEKRNTKILLPTELILTLVKREIAKRKKRTLFIDGFPRDLDQISYSLFFRDLIGYREDPDIFILVDVPEKVIDERIKHRRVCPKCQSTRNLKLHLAKEVKYEKRKKEFYFICDNPECGGERMVRKEGDELGIEPIRERLKMDEKLIEKAFSLQGIPKVLLRNSVPAKEALKYVDDYEITPEYSYRWNSQTKKVKIIEKPWIFPDDQGIPSYSLLPSPIVLSMIKQIVDVLNL